MQKITLAQKGSAFGIRQITSLRVGQSASPSVYRQTGAHRESGKYSALPWSEGQMTNPRGTVYRASAHQTLEVCARQERNHERMATLPTRAPEVFGKALLSTSVLKAPQTNRSTASERKAGAPAAEGPGFLLAPLANDCIAARLRHNRANRSAAAGLRTQKTAF